MSTTTPKNELSATLEGGGTTTFSVPITAPSVRAVGFGLPTATPGLSGVDNFEVEVIPEGFFGGLKTAGL